MNTTTTNEIDTLRTQLAEAVALLLRHATQSRERNSPVVTMDIDLPSDTRAFLARFDGGGK